MQRRLQVERGPAWLGGVTRALWGLTPAEQRAVLLIMGLLLLGAAARAWHQHHEARNLATYGAEPRP